MAMSKTDIAKKIVATVVGLSTTFTVTNAIRNNVSAENKRQKAQRYIGSATIGYMVGEVAESRTDVWVDNVIAKYKDVTGQTTTD